jgi:hypothetical protein
LPLSGIKKPESFVSNLKFESQIMGVNMERSLKHIDLHETPRLFERRVVLGILTSAAVTLATGLRADPKPTMKVSKSPSCTCCTAWIEHLRSNGFMVTVTDTSDIRGVKARAGVPGELSSCHTGEISGYVIEGHVPAHAIQRLLAEKPNAIGLAVPGMPVGSPGMEGGTPVAYDVILFTHDHQQVFGRYSADQPI